MKVKLTLITISIIFIAINIMSAQSLTKFSGLTYFDYFYNFTNNVSDKDKSHGFQFRRVFFTVDFDISNKLSARFRIEPDEKSLSTQNRFFLSLKDLYAQYKIENVNLFIGLMPTPQIEVEEKYWGYRSVEKIQSDLRGMVATRDVGIALRGKSLDNNFSYWILFGNNSSHGAETDKYKRLYLQLLNQFNQSFAASLDLNFANGPQNKNYFYSRLGFYFSENELSGGITFVGGLKQKSSSLNTDIKESGISLFGNYSLQPYLRTLVRFDYYDPDIQKTKNGELTFIGGLDYKLEKNFSIIPNLIFNYYENRELKDDLTGRITFYYQF